jgi:predicted amidophosphoribosyltransferase
MDKRFTNFVAEYKTVYLTSSAYGSVPSPSHTVTDSLKELLQQANINVASFKIMRDGGFERTDYGGLGAKDRQSVVRARKIRLESDISNQLNDKLVVVFDDLRSTGAHERMIIKLMEQEVKNAQLIFVYHVKFSKKLESPAEERLNHALVKKTLDVLPWFSADTTDFVINSRLLKFLLSSAPDNFGAFCECIGANYCKQLYDAALTSDGYYKMSDFQVNFRQLENFLMKTGALHKRLSFEMKNLSENKIVACVIGETPQGKFYCAETDVDLNETIQTYSRFKFGDVEAIHYLSDKLARVIIQSIKTNTSLRLVFERAKERKEYINLVAPGIRNVVSASNFLMREVGLRANSWLSNQGLPTMSIRTLGRLGSGRDNYADLSAEERLKREKHTQTIIPRSEYEEFPTHVIFLDDVEVSGQTEKRAKYNTLSAGALSFHSVFVFQIDPILAMQDASIESRMNQFSVKGGLDETVASILSHPDYQPVQRMLRLLLHPRNTRNLRRFVEENLSDLILKRIYMGAMSNDYLWIASDASDAPGKYSPSLEILRLVLLQRGLLELDGILK